MLEIAMQAFQIGEVSQKTGLSIDAIRFYEKEGLLERPARSDGGYRLYQERQLADLEFIRKAQHLGFSLSEIRELLSIQRHPVEACAHVQDLISHKLTVVHGKIEELQNLEARLSAALKLCKKSKTQAVKHSCPVLNEIAMSNQRRKRS